MTREEIVDDLAKKKIVEEIVHNVAKVNNDIVNDLVQDIYLHLMIMDEKKLIHLYSSGQIKFYLSRVIVNNWCSVNSPFYRVYRKPTIYDEIDEWRKNNEEKDIEDNDE